MTVPMIPCVFFGDLSGEPATIPDKSGNSAQCWADRDIAELY
jgi:hypothetical protein